ncbi:MAG: hypothetical protein Q9159_005728 [Coniocarpon cinnabarinum]
MSQVRGDANAGDGAKLWGGRFTGASDPLMVAYNASINYDRQFYRQDIAGSIAYARANIATGILTPSEFSKIEAGLRRVEVEWEEDRFVVKEEIDEDIHTANERRLGELIGKDVAGKLHTGRSRNDQVATDMRMWLRDELRKIQAWLRDFVLVFAQRAEQEMEYVMPGYTHLQPAQPVRWSQWLMSYGLDLAEDLQELEQVIKRVNKCPLGCGSISGNAFGIDREAMAKELGFEGLIENSMSAVGDRFFVFRTLQWGSMLMIRISRWAEDLITYSSPGFGFVQLADAYSTGSSLMPQKKNPDSLELLRGKSARASSHVDLLKTVIKGIPSTYNKDLQESVEAMLDHVKTVGDSVRIATGVLSTLKIRPEKMQAALSPDMLATDLADYLVRRGVPFREAHSISGKVVLLAENEGLPMDRLTFEQMSMVDSRFEKDVLTCFNYENSVEMKSSRAGTSRDAILRQVNILKEMIMTR